MPFCCGKDRDVNFCPECGKPMNKEAGLRGLLRYVTQQHATYEKKAKEAEQSLKTILELAAKNPEYYSVNTYIKPRKRTAEAARKKADQWRDWQECLIKAIDGP